jgi:1,4-dihydroxy-2-naphthoyl-CoA hydrolase
MTEPPHDPLDPPRDLTPVPGTLEDVLGFELLEMGEEAASGRFAVEDRVRQPFGIVHGGVYAAMAESLASWATALVVGPQGSMAMGQSNFTSFLRPVSEGTVHVQGRCRHRGRTSWVWEVDFTDDAGKLCASTRVTMAVRPRA